MKINIKSGNKYFPFRDLPIFVVDDFILNQIVILGKISFE